MVKSRGSVPSVEGVCGTRGLIESNISEPLSPDMLLAPCSAARNKQKLQCSAVQRCNFNIVDAHSKQEQEKSEVYQTHLIAQLYGLFLSAKVMEDQCTLQFRTRDISST